MKKLAKSPYPDPHAEDAYFEWKIVRKPWSEQGGKPLMNGAAIRAMRYRAWYRKPYIGTSPIRGHDYHLHIMIDYRAYLKQELVVARKRWKRMNTRTAYLYWRDFGG